MKDVVIDPGNGAGIVWPLPDTERPRIFACNLCPDLHCEQRGLRRIIFLPRGLCYPTNVSVFRCSSHYIETGQRIAESASLLSEAQPGARLIEKP